MNVPAAILNTPTHLVNAVISPFTHYRFQTPVALIRPSNEQERQGMEAMSFGLAMQGGAEVAEGLGASEVVSRISYGEVVETAGEVATAGGVT